MRRRRRSFANGSTLAGSVGLGLNLETGVNSWPAVDSVASGWRERLEAAFDRVRLSVSGQGVGGAGLGRFSGQFDTPGFVPRHDEILDWDLDV